MNYYYIQHSKGSEIINDDKGMPRLFLSLEDAQKFIEEKVLECWRIKEFVLTEDMSDR